MDITNLPPILTAAEAAQLLCTSVRTVQRLCNDGALVSCRAGNRYRVNRDSLLRYMGYSPAQTEEA